MVLQDGTRVNTAAIPAQPKDSDLAYYGHHPNSKWAHNAKTIHHGQAQRRSLQRRQPARQIINMHSKPLVGPATPLLWRQPARRSMPATRQARAHAQWHGNNPRPTRLGCTPRRPLHQQRHSLRPPGRPNNAQCLSLQRRQPARQRPPTGTVTPQCFTGRPIDTPAVETTGQAEHACNTPSSGTRPEARQQPKTYATRMHAPAALAPVAPPSENQARCTIVYNGYNIVA